MQTARSQDQRQQMLGQTFHRGVWWGQDDGLASQSGNSGRFRVFWSVFIRAISFLPVIQFCGVPPSPSSLAEFETGLFSSEGLHLSAPRWLLLLSDLHQRRCYQSRKITGPLRSNREQNMMVNQGTARFVPNGPFASFLVNYVWAGWELSAQLICLQLWKLRPK